MQAIPTQIPFVAETTFSRRIAIRDRDGGVKARLRGWIHDRLRRQLGKYAPQIERIDVRFGDENGPKGGLDRSCMVHVVLSALTPVVVEMRAGSDREAFDLAASRAERATQRTLQKHGFSTRHKRVRRAEPATSRVEAEPLAVTADDAEESREGMYGHREGHQAAQLRVLQARPEKERRDARVDTALPGVSADMRKVGYGHTASRNTKLNTAGMSYALEDSTTGKPSRKSTRGSSNGSKPASGLTIRTKSAVHNPKAIAHKAAAR
jgi:putative sigma-54 modulation protein